MKQYTIDELREVDYQKIKNYFDKNLSFSKIEGIYHLILPPSLLNKIQKKHKSCAPFYFAIHLTESVINAELLVRAKKKMRCNCIEYANEIQREFLINYIDSILIKLNIEV